MVWAANYRSRPLQMSRGRQRHCSADKHRNSLEKVVCFSWLIWYERNAATQPRPELGDGVADCAQCFHGNWGENVACGDGGVFCRFLNGCCYRNTPRQQWGVADVRRGEGIDDSDVPRQATTWLPFIHSFLHSFIHSFIHSHTHLEYTWYVASKTCSYARTERD